ncbi:hypothetical protein PVK06_019402 [Gossypium arboreum]|uniref:Uncharacterized protein n=1 Tax=Gossypium arboreum TaxID=29729 RepID=A0ABR0PJZ6_GOSAR|nr:hypothetical protein PVK06_019402 [Gossypium arboreum]
MGQEIRHTLWFRNIGTDYGFIDRLAWQFCFKKFKQRFWQGVSDMDDIIWLRLLARETWLLLSNLLGKIQLFLKDNIKHTSVETSSNVASFHGHADFRRIQSPCILVRDSSGWVVIASITWSSFTHCKFISPMFKLAFDNEWQDPVKEIMDKENPIMLAFRSQAEEIGFKKLQVLHLPTPLTCSSDAKQKTATAIKLLVETPLNVVSCILTWTYQFWKLFSQPETRIC